MNRETIVQFYSSKDCEEYTRFLLDCNILD